MTKLLTFFFLAVVSQQNIDAQSSEKYKEEVFNVLKDLVLVEAAEALKEKPTTITATICQRSSGGKHDFYSEGDYWWPDKENPNGPYIQRDGETNPDNFVAHRQSMIRFSKIIGCLTSAWIITKEKKYADQAMIHLKAWLVDTATMMNPSLLYAQAIKGRATGRGIGIIDTIQLMEVAQGVYVLQHVAGVDQALIRKIKMWFEKYLTWLTTHQYGKDEMNAGNNHGTCWVMQVASFARLTANTAILDQCRERFKNVLLPNQMANDGSFPRELRRTKPFGYSLFNLDAMAMVCHILSNDKINLWEFKLSDDRSIGKGIDFLFPYVLNKNNWTLSKDVMYWDQWPVAHPFLLFGSLAYNKKEWLDAWKKLDHYPKVDEVIRNLPIRNPIIWLN